MLTAQLKVLKGDFLCFDDIVVKIKQFPIPERKMINEVSFSMQTFIGIKIRQQVHLVKDPFPLPED